MNPLHDNDLKRLKEISMMNVKEGDVGFIFLIKDSLLARLEAGEKALELAWYRLDDKATESDLKAYMDWREKAGK